MKSIEQFFGKFKESQHKNLSDYYHSLSKDEQQEVLKLFKEYKHKKEGNNNNIPEGKQEVGHVENKVKNYPSLRFIGSTITDSGKEYSFNEEENFLGQLDPKGKLPIKDKEEVSLNFFNEEGEAKVFKVRKNGANYEFLNAEGKYQAIKETGENSRTFTYNASSSQEFFESVSEAYEVYKGDNLSLSEAVAEKRVDLLLERFALKDYWREATKLNYFVKGEQGLKDQYGTFLHKALNKLPAKDFVKLITDLKSLLPLHVFHEYLELGNEAGKTVLGLAKAGGKKYEEQTKALESALPNKPIKEEEGIDTHQASVHRSVNKAMVGLTKNLNEDLKLDVIVKAEEQVVEVNRTAEFKKVIEDNFRQLEEQLLALAKLGDKEVYEYLKPSLPLSEQSQAVDSEQAQAIIKGFRFELGKVSAMFADITEHDKLGDHYKYKATELANCGLSIKEMLALSYYSLRDEKRLINPKESRSAEISFIHKLYEIRRGYNIDYGEDKPQLHIYSQNSQDKNICQGGTVNKLADSLNGIHRDVEIKVITAETLKDSIRAEIYRQLKARGKELLGDSYGVNLHLWRINKRLPKELKDQIKDYILPSIVEEISKEYRDFFNQMQVVIYGDEVVESLLISRELEKEAESSLDKNSGEKLLSIALKTTLPSFMLSGSGYIPTFEYIAERVGGYERVLEQVKSSKELSSLLGEDYLFALSSMNPEARGLVISKFYELSAINAQDPKGNSLAHALAMLGDRYNLELLMGFGGNLNLKNKNGAFPLTVAAANGHKEVVEVLLEKAGKEISPAYIGFALLLAAENGHKEIVGLILEKVGAEISSEYKGILLKAAARYNHKELVVLLLEKVGSEISSEDKCDALGWAAKNGNKELVALLLEKAGPEIHSKAKSNALGWAAQNGNKELVALLLEKAGLEIHSKAKSNALGWAAGKGHKDVVEVLLEKAGKEISSLDKANALSLAVENGHKEIVEVLLEKAGADIFPEYIGSILKRAADMGHKEIVGVILEKAGAEISSEDKGYALLQAAKIGHKEMVEVILEKAGAEISSKDKGKALRIAAEKGYKEIVEVLLVKAGADILPEKKEEALSYAIENGHKEIVEVILEKEGAEISAEDKGDALTLAAENGNKELAELILEKAGAQISSEDKGDALILAAEKDHKELVELLLEKEGKEIYKQAITSVLQSELPEKEKTRVMGCLFEQAFSSKVLPVVLGVIFELAIQENFGVSGEKVILSSEKVGDKYYLIVPKETSSVISYFASVIKDSFGVNSKTIFKIVESNEDVTMVLNLNELSNVSSKKDKEIRVEMLDSLFNAKLTHTLSYVKKQLFSYLRKESKDEVSQEESNEIQQLKRKKFVDKAEPTKQGIKRGKEEVNEESKSWLKKASKRDSIKEKGE